MKNSSFIKSFTVIGAGTVISMLLGLFTTPVITRLVVPEVYGAFSMYTLYSQIALIVLCLGLDQALVRYYYIQDSVAYRRSLLYECVHRPIVACVFASLLCMAFSLIGFFNFGFSHSVMLLLCLYSLSQLVYRFSQLLIRLSNNSKLYSILNVVQKSVYILCVIPALYFSWGDHFYVLAISSLISILTVLSISIGAQFDVWNFRLGILPDIGISKDELLRYAYPFIISSGVAQVFQAADKIILNMYTDYYEVGIYSSAMTLVSIFAIVQNTFNALWTPMAVENFSKNPDDRSLYQKGNQSITVVMFLIGITVILCKDLFVMLLGVKYREAAMILPLLIFYPIMYTITETTGSGLMFMKKSQLQIFAVLIPCLANIVGNVLLVPIMGSKGAAISTALSFILFFSVKTWLSNRYFYVDFYLKKFYLLSAIVFLYALFNMFIPFGAYTIIGYVICFSLIMILYRRSVAMMVKKLFAYLETKS